MISNVTHSLSDGFVNSIEAYREHLNEKKSNATVAAVHVSDAQHKQKQADIYTSSLSNSSEPTPTSSPQITDPYEAYKTSMKYQNRMDLVDALQKAGEGDFGKPSVDPYA